MIKDSQKISYKQLHQKVSKAANGLKKLGIKKGDRVTLFNNDTRVSNFNACLCKWRSSLNYFWGFSADSISGRVNDCSGIRNNCR